MNGSYTVPFLLSLIIHSTVVAYTISWIDLPVINLNQAPSALEICVVGMDEDAVKNENRQRSADHRTSIKDNTKDVSNIVETRNGASLLPEEKVHKTQHKKPKAQNQEHTSVLGNSTISHQSIIGAQYKMKDPSIVFNPSPHYPRRARERGEEGMVILDVAILHDGTVGEITIFSSSGYSLLDKAALAAVSRWRFKPARINGQTISLHRKIPVVFKLE